MTKENYLHNLLPKRLAEKTYQMPPKIVEFVVSIVQFTDAAKSCLNLIPSKYGLLEVGDRFPCICFGENSDEYKAWQNNITKIDSHAIKILDLIENEYELISQLPTLWELPGTWDWRLEKEVSMFLDLLKTYPASDQRDEVTSWLTMFIRRTNMLCEIDFSFHWFLNSDEKDREAGEDHSEANSMENCYPLIKENEWNGT